MIRVIYGFPECLVLWARLELSALPGKLERNRGGEAMNRGKSRVLWARISPIQAISLLFLLLQRLGDLFVELGRNSG